MTVLVYPKHHPWDLEPHYTRHVSAMTSEALHSKADIAIQLAWRDQEIERLSFLAKGQEAPWTTTQPDKIPVDDQPVWFVVRRKVMEGVFAWGTSLSRSYFNVEDGAWCADQVSHWMPRFIEPAPPPPKETP
jgi:hypothetical protein